jgi:hypothetical protein
MPPTTPQTLKRLITLSRVIIILVAICLVAVGFFAYSPHVWAVFISPTPASNSSTSTSGSTVPSITPTPTYTPTDTSTPSVTPSPTATLTQTFTPTYTPTDAPTDTPTPTQTPEPLVLTFAVIGDFGMNNTAEADVAALIHSWQPEIIISLGDNNAPDGRADTIDANIGKYFHDYIHPYTGSYGSGADINRFFPILGNHDWNTGSVQAYLDYLTLPGNERYYDFTWGPVHFFALDSCLNEPDGVKADSVQSAWLQQGLAASTSPWNVVISHYPAYSSGYHGSVSWIQWPFAAWGADTVMAGHDHNYERLLVDGIPYFTNGLGGQTRYSFKLVPIRQSQFFYDANFGAMRVTASETEMLFEFYNRVGELIDSYQVTKP